MRGHYGKAHTRLLQAIEAYIVANGVARIPGSQGYHFRDRAGRVFPGVGSLAEDFLLEYRRRAPCSRAIAVQTLIAWLRRNPL